MFVPLRSVVLGKAILSIESGCYHTPYGFEEHGMNGSRILVGYGAADHDPPLPEPPTQARGAEKRERIYQAALSRFAGDGLAATRVEDVIADAGVSWATFFRYFPRKEDVLVEAAARHFTDRTVAAAREGLADRRLRIRTVLERTFASLLEPAALPQSLHYQALLEVLAGPARFAALVDGDHPQPLIGLVAEILAEGRRRGEIRTDVDPAAAAVTLAAGAMFPAVQAAAVGADAQASVTLALDLTWTGLRPG
jgi:AcrR family transcriptional regulator